MSACSRLAGGDRSNRNRVLPYSVSPSSATTFSPASPRRKTAEDVWTDISLSFLSRHDPISIPAAIIHDFVSSGPFQRNPTFAVARDSTPVLDSPATVLSLSSVCTEMKSHGEDMLGVVLCCGKRGPEGRAESDDQRSRRLIKNRESAARSRARREAYTTELEKEAELLKQENSKLIVQLEKFLSTAPATDGIPRKNSLRRTLTSPF